MVAAGVQVYEYGCDWPAVKFCPLHTLVATALPDLSKICNSTFPFVSPLVPVAVTVAEMAEDFPIAILAGLAVAEELNVVDGFTVIEAAAAFQFHCCQVALNTPTSTV